MYGMTEKSKWISINKSRKKSYPKLTLEQQKLVENHLFIPSSLAYDAIQKTGGWTGSYEYEDLKMVGNFALCVASTKYDESKGASFKTYAWPYVRGYIIHALRDRSRTIRPPRWVLENKKKVKNLRSNGLSIEEVAKELNISIEKVYGCEMSWNDVCTPITKENENYINYYNYVSENKSKEDIRKKKLLTKLKEIFSKEELKKLSNQKQDELLKNEKIVKFLEEINE